MFKMTLKDVDMLKNSVSIISEIIDEGVFHVDNNGISMVSPDRAMVAVIDLKILSTAFEDFNVKGDVDLGMNMANLAAVLKRVKTGEVLTLENEEGSNKLKLTVKGNGVRIFEVPLLDIKSEKPPIEKLAFAGKIELDSKMIEDGIADAEIIGDSVILEANPIEFRMHARGDVSSAQMQIKKTDKGVLDLKASGNIRSQYPLDYLKKMIKASKLSSEMVLEFGSDYPMRMAFKSIDKMNLSFILAPRVEG